MKKENVSNLKIFEKCIITGLLTLVSFTIFASAEWELISHVDDGANFYDIAAINSKRAWIIGQDGVSSCLFFTDDGGKTWKRKFQSNGPAFYEAIYFLDERHGWVVGLNLILLTDDGGETWEEIEVQGYLKDVQFITPELGWAVGNASSNLNLGIILFTEDGGKSWKVYDNKIAQPLYKIHFQSAKKGWITGANLILHTEDGGKRWKEYENILDAWVIGIHFINDKEGWMAGNGQILHTQDGGKSWNPLKGEGISQDMRPWDIHFFNSKEGFILGGRPKAKGSWKSFLWHTVDGGKSWNMQPMEDGYQLAFPTRQEGWIVGGNSTIFHTEDGGKTWERQMERGYYYKDVHFLLSGVGWVVGQSRRGSNAGPSCIIKTTDGGRTWKSIADVDAGVRLIQFLNEKEGWIGGDTLEYTNDGGKRWKKVDVRPYFSDFFFSNDNGWIAYGGSGVTPCIFYTNDGGKRWDLQYPEKAYNLFFLNSREGWAVGKERKTIIHTTDEGKHWKKQFQADSVIYVLYFINVNEGWAVGRDGTVLHTDDGGKHWDKQFSGTFALLTDVLFVSEDEGWAVGSEGTILHTADGGKTWEWQKSGVDTNLWAIDYTRKGLVVVGDWNTILVYHDKRFEKYAEGFSIQPKGKIPVTWGGLKTVLYQNYPNPFNPETWIPYQLSQSSPVSLFIYNSQGKLVRKISLGYRQAGVYLTKEQSVYWDGRNDYGEEVSSGIYFYTISAGAFIDSKKMLLVR